MLGIRLGYYTEDPITAWEIDSLVDFSEGLTVKFVARFVPVVTQGKTLDESQTDEWIANSYDKACPIYEKRLEGHGKRFLAGDKITIADFKAFAHFIQTSDINRASPCSREALDKINACVAKYPHVQRWVDYMKQECNAYITTNRVPTLV